MSAALSGRRILLLNPPGRVLLRGEGRADALLEKAAVSWIYPPMNLAYGAACLRREGAEPRIRDYPAEGKGPEALSDDLAAFRPDLAILNVNASSVADDLAAAASVRAALPSCRLVALAPFEGVHPAGARSGSNGSSGWIREVDAVLTAEYPELLVPLAEGLLSCGTSPEVPGVIRWDAAAAKPLRTDSPRMGSLDALPFPARDLLENRLYLRPDTGLPQAIIQVSRGCPSFCTFCLTPAMTGTQLVQRDPARVVEETRECVERLGIRQVFYRADTFTMSRKWVLEFCERMKEARLGVEWCCNSRADRIDPELARAMREAGCWLVSFGFESGSPETLERTKKGVTVAQNLAARAACREAGLMVLGQLIIGFPWEGPSHLAETERMVKDLSCDFIDIQFLVPYPGTPVWEETPKELLAAAGTKQEGGLSRTAGGLTPADLLAARKRMLRATYLSPGGLWRKVRRLRSPAELLRYARHGMKLLAGGYD